MTPIENESLARHSTFHLGGPARFFVTCTSAQEVEEAYRFAATHDLVCLPLGEGSNVLVPDEGVHAVVVRVAIDGIAFEDQGEVVRVVAGAGVLWESLVDAAVTRGLWGIENLAGIPGSVGGAAVQNIGAYGAELSTSFLSAKIFTSATYEETLVTREEANFGYRTSSFKGNHEQCILEVSLELKKSGAPHTAYPDLADVSVTASPQEVAETVRAIRRNKFPSSADEGTAGSFFKNPVVSSAEATRLTAQYPGLPIHRQKDGTVKTPLAWVLDHVLGLKGYEKDGARLYENQPLILVAKKDARAAAVDALADFVAKKVFDATGIVIEREVELFGEK